MVAYVLNKLAVIKLTIEWFLQDLNTYLKGTGPSFSNLNTLIYLTIARLSSQLFWFIISIRMVIAGVRTVIGLMALQSSVPHMCPYKSIYSKARREGSEKTRGETRMVTEHTSIDYNEDDGI